MKSTAAGSDRIYQNLLEFLIILCYDTECMESRYLERSPCKYFTRRQAALLIELGAQTQLVKRSIRVVKVKIFAI